MPALKLSHPPDAYYAIPRKAAVEEIESQGYLPHQTFMQTQALDTVASCRTAQREPAIAAEMTALPCRWQCLALQKLANFEVVNHQFACQQVWFEAAMALRPSNPAFQTDDAALILMAEARRSGLKATIGKAIIAVDFGFIGSEPLTISCLDQEGHCIAMFKTPTAPLQPNANSNAEKPALQGVTFDTRGAHTLRIDSCAPFVLTRFWIRSIAD